ncbi:MAG: hypothetical protein KGO96_08655 [Elusimicrobia bacterium]|nr:hypothetical protein [Elusimicrobiota bacterium]MDE2237646.1 hypothetical protein [Elusimicrobiota bacterium]MDE2425959.1 hypothetical protein [Elusimicrobiota bacterium]
MEEQKGSGKECGRRCGGCKFMAGILVGLLLAAAAFGLFLAGHCSGYGHRYCPITSMPAPK